MATVSIRLNEDDERDLKAIQKATGLSKSGAIRDAIKTRRALVAMAKAPKQKTFSDRYAELMEARADEPVGPPTDDASHVSERVRAILQAKHERRSGRR